jgi:hypothetical protein
MVRQLRENTEMLLNGSFCMSGSQLSIVIAGTAGVELEEVEQILGLPLHEMEEMRQRCRSVALEYDCASVARGLANLLASELQQRPSCGR